MGAPVVSGCDAPPVLEFGEEVLDLVALTVEDLVVGEGDFVASSSSRNQVLSYPRSAINCEAVGKASSTRRAPL